LVLELTVTEVQHQMVEAVAVDCLVAAVEERQMEAAEELHRSVAGVQVHLSHLQRPLQHMPKWEISN
jgi:hypothetical protein